MIAFAKPDPIPSPDDHERCLAGSLERCLADLKKELCALHRTIAEAITSTPPWKLAVVILTTKVKDDCRIPANRPIAKNGIRSKGRARDSLSVYLDRDNPRGGE